MQKIESKIDDTENKAAIVGEVISGRQAFSKVLRREDNSYVAVSFGEPIHYQDDNGDWHDIDNTLVETQNEDGQTVFKNTADDISIELPLSFDDGPVRVEKDDLSVSFKIQGKVKRSSANVLNTKEYGNDKSSKKQRASDWVKLERQSSVARYCDVLSNTDIEYNVTPGRVKESIILKKASKKQVKYTFEVMTKGLKAKLQPDNSIEFITRLKDEIEFIIPSPFMFDSSADQEFSKDIDVTLDETGEGFYTMTYSLSQEWLNDTARVYPVTIDPTICQTRTIQFVRDTYIRQKAPDTNYYTSQSLRTATSAHADGLSKALVAAFHYPMVSSMTATKIELCVKSINPVPENNNNYLKAYQIMENWYPGLVSWNTQPSVSPNALDCVPLCEDMRLDLTNCISDWYSNVGIQNFGVMLELVGTTTSVCDLYASEHPQGNQYMPCLEIEFQSTGGLDTQYDMHTIDVGRAGSVSLNDFTGQIIVTRSDMNFEGNKSPLELGFFYDSSPNPANVGMPPEWKLSNDISAARLYYYNEFTSSTDYSCYVLNDENGVRRLLDHGKKVIGQAEIWSDQAFAEDESGSESQDGATENENNKQTRDDNEKEPGYELYLSDKSNPAQCVVTVTYPDGKVGHFDSAGDMTSLEDRTQNTSIVFKRSSSYIYEIQDGAGRKYCLPKNGQGKTASVDYYGTGNSILQQINMTYDSAGNLISVTYPDSESVYYTYDTNNRLTSMQNVDGYSVRFTYDLLGRVSKIEEYADNILGDELTVVYGQLCTQFIDSRGRQETKQFNRHGNTTAVRDENGYAIFTAYSKEKSRKMLGTSDIQIPGENNDLIKDWCISAGTGNWTCNRTLAGVSQSIAPGISFYGKLSNTQYNGLNFISQKVYPKNGAHFRRGENFTYGGWGKSNNALPIKDKRTFGMKIEVPDEGSNMGNNLVSSFDFNTFSNQWQYQKGDFTVPYDVEYITVVFSYDYQEGIAEFTGAELQNKPLFGYSIEDNEAVKTIKFPQENEYVPEENIVSSWCFDPVNSWSSNRTLNSYFYNGLKGLGHYGTLSGVLSSAVNYAKQTIYPPNGSAYFKKGEQYTYGGWARSSTARAAEESVSRTFGMRVECETNTPITSFMFDENETGWQFKTDTLTIPCDLPYIHILFVYDYQSGAPNFTGAQLYKKQPEKEEASTERNETKCEYDKWGNILLSSVTNGSVSMDTTNTYSANGNYSASVTDPMGNTQLYDYDENLGTLKSTTDAQGQTTSYTYDSMRRLTGISKNVSGLTDGSAISNSYTYEHDRLKTITHNGFDYRFDYDAWGLSTITKAGNQVLVENTYTNDSRRLPSSVNFGNGQSQIFSYDEKDRLIATKFDNDSRIKNRFTYTYDQKGNLTDKLDVRSGTWTKYRDEKVEQWNLPGTVLKHSYVTDGDKFIEKIGGKITSYTHTSDAQGHAASTSYGYGPAKTAAVENRYDDLDRLTDKGVYVTLNEEKKPILRTDYLYPEMPGFKASQQVQAMKFIFNNAHATDSSTLSYTYDNLGNITGVYRDGELLSCYEYDKAGQLTRVNDAVQDKTFTYIYDKGGNIRGKSEYVFTLGELNSPISTIPYGYADANWKDKLTSINGNPITYDQIGNPLTYNGWVYTWEGGRQLKTAANSDVHVFYTYDDDGIRTRKNINGVTTYYTLVENRITAQRTNWKTTYFRYDNDGELISLNWQGNEYFYVKNLQGDVIGLVDENGSLVVEYAYDAWGKPLSVTGELAGTLGEANPFRYRSYYWDDETGLYYLQSRYYDPEVGRFVNADSTDVLGLSAMNVFGGNLFTYCDNNPVMNSDPTGYYYITLKNFSKLFLVIGMNPIGVALLAIGIIKFRRLLMLKYAKFILRLSAFWGLVVKVIFWTVAVIVGIEIIKPVATAIFDCLLQGKKGITFTLKRTKKGKPYGFNIYAS